MAVTVASKVPFHQFAALLDKINGLSGTDAKKKQLRDFVEEWRSFHKRLHTDNPNEQDSFFPAMRLLLPQLDRDREAYGIKEHTLAKLYIELLGLGKDSPNAQKLLNYRAPKNAKGDAGDFASVAFWILKPRCPDKGTLMIQDVNDALDGVASSNAAKNKDGVRKNLMRLLKNTSAREQKWLIRIIMKELKVGISQQSIFSVYHEDAEDLYNVKMSLEKVCSILKDESVRLHEIEISIFNSFRPMLGDRAAPHKVEQLMHNKPFFVEIKFDGERMQLHKQDGEYKYYSRSGNEYTHIYGADWSSGNFTPFIANCFKPHVQSCILDGEMVGYNAESKTIGTKGENFDIKSKDIAGYHPMLCVFDILLYNGQILANKPLRTRRQILDNVFNAVEGRLILSEFTEKQSRQDCADALNDAIDRREEGIMVKDPDSIYKPNTRKGGWYKIKPEYVGGLMDELDLLVVGGFFGVGSRSHMMSHFLCAVAVPSPGDEKPTTFHTFCKVGSGYSRKELHDFNRLLAEHWKVFDKKNPPSWLELAPGLKQKPDAYIEPEKSKILQIKAAEIIDSDQYKTGCTLRFPRVEKIRDDKPWHSCMTTADITELKQKSDGKLAGQYVDFNDETGEPKKKRTRTIHRAVKPTVGAQFRGVDSGAVKKILEIFEGKEMCVMTGTDNLSKSSIEEKILEFGGSIVQNPGENTFCVVAEKMLIKVRNIVSKGVYDVVKVDWLLRCIEQQQLLPWFPLEMIHVSSKTAAALSSDYDCYGDSYYEDTNEENLERVFQKIENSGDLRILESAALADVEIQYFPHDSVNGLFRLCCVYLDNCTEIENPATHIETSSLDLTGLDLRIHGATIVKSLSQKVSHVILDFRDCSRVKAFREINKSRKKKFHIVLASWVMDCIESGKLLQERHYEPE